VTALDTAYNYDRFRSHRRLAETAADLLPQFTVSTKVGFFPDGHDLHPRRLNTAIDQIANDLGRVPDVVLIHNPECSPRELSDACMVLAHARDEGRCGAWGISTWAPRPLTGIPRQLPAPDVLMTRAGLAVPIDILDAGDAVAERIATKARWGMAPFGGRGNDPLWRTFAAQTFITAGGSATVHQAIVATAFALPEVTHMAIGTNDLEHLAELVAGSSLQPDHERVTRYRSLLRQRASVSDHSEHERAHDAAVHG